MNISKQIILTLVLGLSIPAHTWTKNDANILSKKVTVVIAPSESKKILSEFSDKAKNLIKNLHAQIAQQEYKAGGETMHSRYLREQVNELKNFMKNQKLQVTASAMGANASQDLAAIAVGSKGAKFSVEVPNQIKTSEYSDVTQRTHHFQISVIPTSPEIAQELNIGHEHHHPYKKLYSGQRIRFFTSPASEKKYGVDLELP